MNSKEKPVQYSLSRNSSASISIAHSKWIDALKKNPSLVTTGLNPSILTVLQQTWGWPMMMVFFNCHSNTFALFSAMQVGNKWVSLPHCDQGGNWYNEDFLTSIGISSCNFNQLYKGLVSLAVHSISNSQIKTINVLEFDISIDQLVILSTSRNTQQSTNPWFVRSTLKLNSQNASPKVIHELSLDPSLSILDQFMSGPSYKIRKALRNGLVIRSGTSKLLEEFYTIYRKRIHQLGSFGLPLSFFQNLLSLYMHGTVTIFICYHEGSPVGASILLKFLDYSENMWFATLPGYNKLYPSYLLHYAMIMDSVNHGCKRYSMGRSTAGKGVQRYKSQFGGEQKVLCYNGNINRVMNPPLNIISAIIKNLPISISQPFDNVVAKYWY